VYSTIIEMEVPVNDPAIAGSIPVPVVQLAFDTVPLEE
jgi:hypothetical protein